MRKGLGISLYIIAGFFVYAVCLLAFIEAPLGTKWQVLAGFVLPAVGFH